MNHRQNKQPSKASSIAIPSPRIQKIMAAAGLGSRRTLEAEISRGRIKINQKRAELGATVQANDTIQYQGRNYRVEAEVRDATEVLIYNKPLGEICTRNDPQNRPTVFDRLPHPKQGRWVTVGRLDINTTGLLLLTNDGQLANGLMHPRANIDREYACRVRGQVGTEALQRLRDGVQLDDGPAKFSDIVESGGDGQNRWYHVVIMEGRNREVRRLWESQEVTVSRLKRVRYGPVFLPAKIKIGRWGSMRHGDISVLRQEAGLKAKPPKGLKLMPIKRKTT